MKQSHTNGFNILLFCHLILSNTLILPGFQSEACILMLGSSIPFDIWTFRSKSNFSLLWTFSDEHPPFNSSFYRDLELLQMPGAQCLNISDHPHNYVFKKRSQKCNSWSKHTFRIFWKQLYWNVAALQCCVSCICAKVFSYIHTYTHSFL